ncbi:MAG TPA: aquaporin, partial [Ferruginibacter sp.]|nr:aquaporin [Ferruginibacter sp.]
MNNFLFELIGTAFLILLGDGVVANVVLNKTKGNNGGWIVITFGWAMAVFVGVYISAAQSGAHLNPAVSIALAAAGKFDWANVPLYIAGQFAGAMTGALLVWLAYKKHFDATSDADAKLAVFCNSPAIRNTLSNLTTEIIGTFALLPAIVDAVAPLPVVAAGGIADGRGLAAALMLGAQGVWMGTRFVASPEWGGQAWKQQAILAATSDDTIQTSVYDRLLDRPFPPEINDRVVRNAFNAQW